MSIQKITTDDILDIIFQSPNRIAAGMGQEYFSSTDKSIKRAMYELSQIGIAQQKIQALENIFVKVGLQSFVDYLTKQFVKVGQFPSPDSFTVNYDRNLFLGFFCTDGLNPKKLTISNGNDACSQMREDLRSHIDVWVSLLSVDLNALPRMRR